MQSGFKNALELFKKCAQFVPAYKKFLAENKINYKNIKTETDFLKVPVVTKDNYLRKYDFKNLFLNGEIPPFISMSSGSSGKPFYWPRTTKQDERGGLIHLGIVRDIFKIKKNESTLVVICFSMGTWIAGTYTLASFKKLVEEGYKISIMTPGIEQQDILTILKDLSPNFKNIILTGYPPFIMDVLHLATGNGIDLKKNNLKIILAGESFSEKWRQSLISIGNLESYYNSCISLYGTADADILGHETPVTIFLREKATVNSKLANEIFNTNNSLPTFLQYDPEQRFFEVVDGQLIFTTYAGIPLIRYQINDSGNLFSFKEMENIASKYNLKNDFILHSSTKWKLPFLALGRRADVSLTFYSLNIYIEHLKTALEDNQLKDIVTGKFVAKTKIINNNKDQKLSIKVELKLGLKPSSVNSEIISRVILENLLILNIEYRKLYSSIGDKAKPNIELTSFGDQAFVIKKSKHKWVS